MVILIRLLPEPFERPLKRFGKREKGIWATAWKEAT
jgi:hypothetical protein